MRELSPSGKAAGTKLNGKPGFYRAQKPQDSPERSEATLWAIERTAVSYSQLRFASPIFRYWIGRKGRPHTAAVAAFPKSVLHRFGPNLAKDPSSVATSERAYGRRWIPTGTWPSSTTAGSARSLGLVPLPAALLSRILPVGHA
jgi:hypothetical protein